MKRLALRFFFLAAAQACGACLVAGCGWLGDKSQKPAPASRQADMAGEELLAILPAGSPVVFWANVARARRWYGAEDVGGESGSAAQAAVKEFRREVGFDPWSDLGQVVGTASLREGKLRWHLLLKGEGLRDKLDGRIERIMGKGTERHVTEYREARIHAPRGRGSSVGFLTADLIASGPDVLVRRSVDLLRKRREENVLSRPAVRATWKSLGGREWAGKPVALLAVRNGRWLEEKLTGDWEPLAAVESWGVRVQLGDWVQVVVMGVLADRKKAAALVRWFQLMVNRFVGMEWARKLGLDRDTRFLHVHNEAERVYIQLTLPKKELFRLFGLARSLGLGL